MATFGFPCSDISIEFRRCISANQLSTVHLAVPGNKSFLTGRDLPLLDESMLKIETPNLLSTSQPTANDQLPTTQRTSEKHRAFRGFD